MALLSQLLCVWGWLLGRVGVPRQPTRAESNGQKYTADPEDQGNVESRERERAAGIADSAGHGCVVAAAPIAAL